MRQVTDALGHQYRERTVTGDDPSMQWCYVLVGETSGVQHTRHSSVPDFMKVYHAPYTLLEKDLNGVL